MRKLLAIVCILFGFMFLNNNANAQSEFDIGAGLAFGSEVESIGLHFRGVYGFNEKVSGAADFTYYLPDGYDFYAFNANVHYRLLANENMNMYGLAGLNYATQEVDFGQQLGSVSNSEAGLNLGGGANFGLDFANLFTELKYVVSDYDQLVLTAGLQFSL